MRLLIIRHADPIYRPDTLTEKGRKEAKLLADRLAGEKIDYCYVSPLKRAAETAGYYLRKTGKTAETLDWLHEFMGRTIKPGQDKLSICWDWPPALWTAEPRYFDQDKWWEPYDLSHYDVKKEYDIVIEGLDALLSEHGYVRDGRIYRVEKRSHDTIALFCHLGAECVLLSRLLNIPPMLLWHGLAPAPSSVTTLHTEERDEGIAYFRAQSIGDISHLNNAGEKPSFSARFCECFGDGN